MADVNSKIVPGVTHWYVVLILHILNSIRELGSMILPSTRNI